MITNRKSELRKSRYEMNGGEISGESIDPAHLCEIVGDALAGIEGVKVRDTVLYDSEDYGIARHVIYIDHASNRARFFKNLRQIGLDKRLQEKIVNKFGTSLKRLEQDLLNAESINTYETDDTESYVGFDYHPYKVLVTAGTSNDKTQNRPFDWNILILTGGATSTPRLTVKEKVPFGITHKVKIAYK